MNVFGRFSLSDFLVYLFPGFASGLGLCAIAMATPAGGTLHGLDISLGGGLLLVVSCYVLGVLLAGPSSKVTALVSRRLGLSDPRLSIPQPEDCVAIEELLAARFGRAVGRNGWSSSDFYLCRALVREYLPQAAAEIERQNVLMRMRENLAVPLILWVAGVVAWAFHFRARLGSPVTAIMVAIAAVMAWTLMSSLVRRMNQNRRREVRELCSALLVGEATGAFVRQ